MSVAEDIVMKHLTDAGLDFKRDFKIKKERIDAVLDLPERNLRVLLEVDENQHISHYVVDEVRRMEQVHAYTNLLWIRLNPHYYLLDGVTTWSTPELLHRMEHLIRTYTPTRPVAVAYLNYSSEHGVPSVLHHPDYPEKFKQLVLKF
jgi:carboxypeptidase C (cathepsin A)